VFAVVAILSFVSGLVLPLKYPSALHPALVERPLVLSIGQAKGALPLKEVLLEISFIDRAVGELVFALAMFRPVEKISLVIGAVFPFLFALTVREVV
jgi:hypothetical protein